MSSENDWLMLYNHCILIAGTSRASICDLQRHDVHLVPHVLAGLFTDGRYCNLPELTKNIDEDEKQILSEYIQFLLQHELAFYCSEDDLPLFPSLSKEWLFPAHITHCILDTFSTYNYFNERFLAELTTLGCYFIQFRFFNSPFVEYLDEILSIINTTGTKSVEILLPATGDQEFDLALISWVKTQQKISRIVIFGAQHTEIIQHGAGGMGTVLKTKDQIIDHRDCGVIDQHFFTSNISAYTESLSHNTCLNRKISIDAEGNIKNCPSMQESFGNIKDITLEEALNKHGFKKYWNITKDQISVCKDCEFRHVCTDCRAYVENPEDDYSKPLKCGYDPYTCTWEEWSTHPMKQKAIAYYGLE